jgi:hypothetical protein
VKSYSIVGMEHQKSEAAIAALPENHPVTLVREPRNQYDANAVAIWADGRKVGYVPKKQNKALAAFIDQAGEEWTGPKVPGAEMVMDEAETAGVRSFPGKFFRSPNSRYPMVEVSE